MSDLGFKPDRKSFLGGVSGLGLGDEREEGFGDASDDDFVVTAASGFGDVKGEESPAVVAEAGPEAPADFVLSIDTVSSLSACDGFATAEALSFSGLASSDVGLPTREAGLALVGGVKFLAEGLRVSVSFKEILLESMGSNGSSAVFGIDWALPASRLSCDRLCSPLLRCCLAFEISAIQLGLLACREGLGECTADASWVS